MKTSIRMSDEELHLAVAKIHGWELGPCTCGLKGCKKEIRWHAVKGDGRMIDIDSFAFYPKSPEAVSSVENSLSAEDHHWYTRFLYKIVIGHPPKDDLWPSNVVGLLLKATPRERCVALVELFAKGKHMRSPRPNIYSHDRCFGCKNDPNICRICSRTYFDRYNRHGTGDPENAL